MDLEKTYDPAQVPGVIVAHSPAASGAYIGSPSLVVLADDSYIASHDFFGPGTTYNCSVIYHSNDQGRTWQQICQLTDQWWSTLFVHQDALYILGTSCEYGQIVIRRSTDGGRTWTTPTDRHNGYLTDANRYHCAPMPVVYYQGRLWRAFERALGQRPNWPALVISAPTDKDLLDAKNWRLTQEYPHPWSESQWIEGNIIITPENKLINLLRTNGRPGNDKAAILHIDKSGQTLTHSPATDLIDFPGGGVKFTVRFDAQTQQYWSLGCKQTDPPAQRNTLVLTTSKNLRQWFVKSLILHHSDPHHHAFQYVDWLFADQDMIVLSRTAYDDGLGGAHNGHDANFLSFHRIANFRQRTMEDPPLD